ncbi:unnamed protein product [Phyllotreta striolata]|uniref:Microsomal glutathione S-transferase 1 n=1 Tax=Phyllotreta striolata TaxID=444603 RepID=A0A9N9XI26_PHYSR|nr:unnamed protein product [Phyllotreta striolata]
MAQAIPSVLSLENEVFRSFLFYSCILVLKMLFMSPLTGSKRMKHKAFANVEDAKGFNVKPKLDDNVERVRRAHLNDIENIPLFFVAGVLYTITNPSVYLAKMLFLVYTVARVAHTIVYAVVPLPQPARGISWVTGFGITVYMTVMSLIHFL